MRIHVKLQAFRLKYSILISMIEFELMILLESVLSIQPIFLILMWDFFTWIWRASMCLNFSFEIRVEFLSQIILYYTLTCISIIWCASRSPDFISCHQNGLYEMSIFVSGASRFTLFYFWYKNWISESPSPKKGENKCMYPHIYVLDLYFICDSRI